MKPTQACVGYPDDDSECRMWFTRWFIDRRHFDAPAAIWTIAGDIVTRTSRGGEPMTWDAH